MEPTQPFCTFVSAAPSSWIQLDPTARRRPAIGKGRSSHVNFDQLSYSATHGIESMIVAYRSTGTNQLTFANRPGLQFHLRRQGTGVYSFDRSQVVSGKECEMQVYCAPADWSKRIFERPGATAQSVLFALPYERAKGLLGRHAADVHRRAEAEFFHMQLPIRPFLVAALDELLVPPVDGISEMRHNARLLDILAGSIEIFRDGLAQTRRVPRLRPTDVAKIEVAERRILDDLANYPGIAELARGAGMSVSKFKTAFRRVTGRPVKAYVVDARMSAAARMLEEGRNVTEVALALGHLHCGHFARTFRATFGVTPSQFRENRGRAHSQ